jgi:hypothetical protein
MSKIKTSLKTLSITGLASVAALSGSFSVHADDQPQTAVDSQAQIGATLNATGDSIQQLLDKMSAQKPHDSFQHADYLAKSAKVQAKIEAAFSNFKQVLANDILPKLESYMADYDSIATSTNYSDSQKAALLSGLHTQLNSLVPTLQNQYQGELLKLYTSAGLTVISANSDWVQNTVVSCNTDSKDASLVYPQENNSSLPFSNATAFKTSVFPALADGCLSQSCISLSAVDQMLLLSLIDGEFEHNLNFKLSDGTAISLNSNFKQNYNCETPNGWSSMVNTAIDYVGRADFYPAGVAQLPFDATPSDVQAAASKPRPDMTGPVNNANLEQQARDATIAQLTDRLLQIDRTGEFQEDWRVVANFCNNETHRNPCMSEAEQKKFMDTIHAETDAQGAQIKFPKNFDKNIKMIITSDSAFSVNDYRFKN